MPLDPTDHDLLITIDERLGNLSRQLFGNGQSGVITRLSDRVRRLEKFHWLVIGAVVAVSFLLGLSSNGWIKAFAH